MKTKIGTKGVGHGGNSKLPAIQRIGEATKLVSGLEPGTQAYRLGPCLILLSPPCLENDNAWHMSISTPKRYPTWDEIAKAWYELVPDAEYRTAVLILPPKSEYINIHSFCMQVNELTA